MTLRVKKQPSNVAVAGWPTLVQVRALAVPAAQRPGAVRCAGFGLFLAVWKSSISPRLSWRQIYAHRSSRGVAARQLHSEEGEMATHGVFLGLGIQRERQRSRMTHKTADVNVGYHDRSAVQTGLECACARARSRA